MKRFRKIHEEFEGMTRRVVIVDTATGVCYLEFARGDAGGVTVLLDADGRPLRHDPGGAAT